MSKATTTKQKIPKNDVATPSTPLTTPVLSGSGLPELFIDGVKDMYWGEKHLVKSLPKMISAAGAPELKAALSNHLAETREHVVRLEEVLELLGQKVQAKKCDALEGVVLSGEHIIENTIAGSKARDLGLIMSALKVENFEITTYEGLIQLAEKLGNKKVASILQTSLNDEVAADELLVEISQVQPTTVDSDNL